MTDRIEKSSIEALRDLEKSGITMDKLMLAILYLRDTLEYGLEDGKGSSIEYWKDLCEKVLRIYHHKNGLE